MRSVLGIDIGGSAVKACIAAWSDHETLQWRNLTPVGVSASTFVELREIVVDIVRRNSDVDAVGISTAGTVSLDGVVLRAGSFSGYEDVDWSVELGRLGLELPVAVLNDGFAATLAEFEARDDRQVSHSLHFVVGTGIGGGLVVQGQPARGEHGYAGALGHIKIITGLDAALCGCGGYGCVQTVASAKAVLRRYTERAIQTNIVAPERANPFALLSDLDQSERQLLRSVMSEAGGLLGRAIGSAANMFDPGLITIGGGLIDVDHLLGRNGTGPYMSAAIDEAYSSSLGAVRRSVQITHGKLGNEAGGRGAAIVALRKLT